MRWTGWRRPLHAHTQALTDAGRAITEVVEPRIPAQLLAQRPWLAARQDIPMFLNLWARRPAAPSTPMREDGARHEHDPASGPTDA